jgi:thiol-disulfide isomerase/thioredoxin
MKNAPIDLSSCGSFFLKIGIILAAVYLFYYISGKREGFSNGGGGKYKFVMYFSPGCGHCTRAMPAFNQLGRNTNINGKKVEIIKIDPRADPNSVIAKQRIRGYPTFHLYDPQLELMSEYSGDRTRSGFLKFLRTNVR